ncbi:DMT family transporter [Polaromonas sp. P1(28)-8]|nr:DMT family transporter [Polaromonas sp. P1(28)-8]
MSDALVGYLLAAGALLLFTTSTLVTKAASSRIQLGLGFLIATVVNVGFSALVFAVHLAVQGRSVQWNTRAFWLFVLAGAFSTYLGRWFFYESVVRFGPARASIFQVSSPLFAALMAWLLLGERLTLLVAGGMAMAIGGLVLVSYKPGFISRRLAVVNTVSSPGSPPMTIKPTVHERLLQSALLLGLGSSLAYAIGNVLRGAAVRDWNEPILGALAGAVCGLVLHLAFSPGKRELVARLRAASRSGAWLYALIGVCTISAQICVISSMRYIPLAIATLVTLCTPLLVFPLSHLLFKDQEEITATTLLGSALTLLGILIIVMR